MQHNTGFLTPAVREATHPKPQTKGRSRGIWRKKVTFRRKVNEAVSEGRADLYVKGQLRSGNGPVSLEATEMR